MIWKLYVDPLASSAYYYVCTSTYIISYRWVCIYFANAIDWPALILGGHVFCFEIICMVTKNNTYPIAFNICLELFVAVKLWIWIVSCCWTSSWSSWSSLVSSQEQQRGIDQLKLFHAAENCVFEILTTSSQLFLDQLILVLFARRSRRWKAIG